MELAVRRRLPLFVLPTVLLPGMLMPLHVFEPRYRRLAAHCLEADRRFGVIFHDPDLSGPFAVREGLIGCTAEILQFQPLPDGRSLMLTRGQTRFRIADGIETDTPYAQALVDALTDLPDTDADATRRQASIALFRNASRYIGALEPDPFDSDAELSFALASAIRSRADWRQRLLETRSEIARLGDVDRLLRSWMEA